MGAPFDILKPVGVGKNERETVNPDEDARASSIPPGERTTPSIDVANQTTVALGLPQHLPTVAAEDALIGSQLDVYDVVSLLGQGGMGRVYKAWHRRLHRQSAVKVILPEIVQADPLRLEMFFAEARLAAKLQHPHVVAIHSLGEDAGYHFIEMEYVDGKSLFSLIEEFGRFNGLQSTQLMRQAALALVAAHQVGLVHGDVKPQNLMVKMAGNWEVKLGDFGLARAYSQDRGWWKTRLAGTPAFMAPELFAGQPPTQASDIYALGATYFALLTGRTPFAAQTLTEMAQRHAEAPPPAASEERDDIPHDISELIQRMLAKDPDQRPLSNGDLPEALRKIETSLVDLEQLVAEAMTGVDAQWSFEKTFRFDVPLVNGRRQILQGEVIDPQGSTGEQLFSLWTPCAPAKPEYYHEVLELNGKLDVGAISIRSWRGEPYFVMVENLHRGSVAPVEIRAAVLNLARAADGLELRLTGRDLH